MIRLRKDIVVTFYLTLREKFLSNSHLEYLQWCIKYPGSVSRISTMNYQGFLLIYVMQSYFLFVLQVCNSEKLDWNRRMPLIDCWASLSYGSIHLYYGYWNEISIHLPYGYSTDISIYLPYGYSTDISIHLPYGYSTDISIHLPYGYWTDISIHLSYGYSADISTLPLIILQDIT